MSQVLTSWLALYFAPISIQTMFIWSLNWLRQEDQWFVPNFDFMFGKCVLLRMEFLWTLIYVIIWLSATFIPLTQKMALGIIHESALQLTRIMALISIYATFSSMTMSMESVMILGMMFLPVFAAIAYGRLDVIPTCLKLLPLFIISSPYYYTLLPLDAHCRLDDLQWSSDKGKEDDGEVKQLGKKYLTKFAWAARINVFWVNLGLMCLMSFSAPLPLAETEKQHYDHQQYRYFEMVNHCKISGIGQKEFSDIITYMTFAFVFIAYFPVFSKMALQLWQCLSTCVSKCISRSTPQYVLLDQKFLDQKGYGSTEAPEAGANSEQAENSCSEVQF